MEEAYVQQLRRQLRKARQREEVYEQTIIILSVACFTLACALALYTGLV